MKKYLLFAFLCHTCHGIINRWWNDHHVPRKRGQNQVHLENRKRDKFSLFDEAFGHSEGVI